MSPLCIMFHNDPRGLTIEYMTDACKCTFPRCSYTIESRSSIWLSSIARWAKRLVEDVKLYSGNIAYNHLPSEFVIRHAVLDLKNLADFCPVI